MAGIYKAYDIRGIYPDQINAVIEAAREAGDSQIVNLVVFVCEGGFRFQELQFLFRAVMAVSRPAHRYTTTADSAVERRICERNFERAVAGCRRCR